MELIDVIIFSSCVIGLIYFAFDRLKYSNKKTYHEKNDRLNQLRKTIAAIENDNRETEELIKLINHDTVYDDEFTDKLIKYGENEYKLNDLKNEKKTIEKYIKNAGKYFKY